jgi:hypothetical protein
MSYATGQPPVPQSASLLAGYIRYRVTNTVTGYWYFRASGEMGFVVQAVSPFYSRPNTHVVSLTM